MSELASETMDIAQPAGATQRGVRTGRRSAPAAAYRWLFLLACLVGWQLWAGSQGNVVFPTPLQILATAREQWLSGPASHLFLTDSVSQDILPSLGKILAGWAICAVLGVVLGMAIGLFGAVADYLSPLLAFGRALPAVMMLPVFLLLFHIGTEMQLATIVFGGVWPVLLNTIDGVRSVDQTKVDTALAFRVSRPRLILGIVFPGALPKIFAGLRVSLGLALILLVLSEMVGSTNGIGYLVTSAGQTFQYRLMWAGIAVVSVLGYGLNRLLLAVERRSLRWHHGAQQLTEG